MRMRQIKFWLVLLNLLTFNSYAFAASMVPQVDHYSPTRTQHAGCEHMSDMKSTATHQASAQDMPCCKHMHGNAGLNDSCGCKTGACGAAQLTAVTNSFVYTQVCSSLTVDAMSTLTPITKRGQRLLRPPIL